MLSGNGSMMSVLILPFTFAEKTPWKKVLHGRFPTVYTISRNGGEGECLGIFIGPQ